MGDWQRSGPQGSALGYGAVAGSSSGGWRAFEDGEKLIFQPLVRAEAVEEGLDHRPDRVQVGELDLLADPGEIIPNADVRQAQAPDGLGPLGVALLRHGEHDLLLDGEVLADRAVELLESGRDELELSAVQLGDQLAGETADFAGLGPPALEVPNVAGRLRHCAQSLLRRALPVASLFLVGAPGSLGVAGPEGAPGPIAGPEWTDCGGGLECASLRVPLDHAHPEGRGLDLALIPRPAGDPARRIGPLVLNPGGPGASGVRHLRETVDRLNPALLDRFDVVSFDPRGIGASAGLDCQDDLERWLSADPTPDDAVEWAALAGAARALARGGRAFVLDAAIAPGLSLAEFTLQQARALERAFVRPTELGAVEERIERSPIRSANGRRSAGPADLALALAGSLYAPRRGQAALRRALRRALEGDGSGLVDLADAYLEVRADGSYPNSFEANLAVTCLDLAAPRALPCAFWSVDPAPLQPLSAAGAAPILIVGRTRDPVTPFAWAEALASALDSGVLLPVEGGGHASSHRGNACVTGVIRDYLIDVRLPQVETSRSPRTLRACH